MIHYCFLLYNFDINNPLVAKRTNFSKRPTHLSFFGYKIHWDHCAKERKLIALVQIESLCRRGQKTRTATIICRTFCPQQGTHCECIPRFGHRPTETYSTGPAAAISAQRMALDITRKRNNKNAARRGKERKGAFLCVRVAFLTARPILFLARGFIAAARIMCVRWEREKGGIICCAIAAKCVVVLLCG